MVVTPTNSSAMPLTTAHLSKVCGERDQRFVTFLFHSLSPWKGIRFKAAWNGMQSKMIPVVTVMTTPSYDVCTSDSKFQWCWMLLTVDSKALMGILRHNLENRPRAIKHSCHPTSILLHTAGTYTPGYRG